MLCTTGPSLFTTAVTVGALYVCSVGLAIPTGLCKRFHKKPKKYFVQINRIYHRSPMQTEKSQPKGKRMIPETRFTEFPALPLTRELVFLGLRRRPMID